MSHRCPFCAQCPASPVGPLLQMHYNIAPTTTHSSFCGFECSIPIIFDTTLPAESAVQLPNLQPFCHLKYWQLSLFPFLFLPHTCPLSITPLCISPSVLLVTTCMPGMVPGSEMQREKWASPWPYGAFYSMRVKQVSTPEAVSSELCSRVERHAQLKFHLYLEKQNVFGLFLQQWIFKSSTLYPDSYSLHFPVAGDRGGAQGDLPRWCVCFYKTLSYED